MQENGSLYVAEFSEKSWFAVELALFEGLPVVPGTGTINECNGACTAVASGIPLLSATTVDGAGDLWYAGLFGPVMPVPWASHNDDDQRGSTRGCSLFCRLGISRQRAHRWLARWDVEGEAGLVDRPSRPHRSPTRIPGAVELRVIEARERLRVGPDRFAAELGVAARTFSRTSEPQPPGANRLLPRSALSAACARGPR